ncbi:MAG: TonB-dependent receptor [Bacteroidota bacterium]
MRIYIFLFILISAVFAHAQQTGSIKGVTSDDRGLPLPGTTIQIKSLNKGVIADFDGNYAIEAIPEGTYDISFSFVGYTTLVRTVVVQSGVDTRLDVTLSESTNLLDEVIITANRQPQKLTEVPATVNVIRAKEIAEFPGFNIGELAARQKGVDFVRSGVLGTNINIRGFNSAFNAKNLQITDYRLSTLIATGLPFNTFATITKDDVERVEILLGPNGTLYGPNAHNGLVSTITKNPRDSEGTTIAVGAGNQSVLTVRARHAQVLSDKFSYKIHFERSQGTDFDYVDTVYVDTGMDVIGYEELELDRDFDTQKYGASVYFKPTEESELVAYYGHSNNNNLAVTNAGRNQIKDWSIDIAQLRYTSPRLFANAYYTWSGTEDTYAINQRTQNYVSFIENGFTEEEALERSFTEQWNSDFGIAIPRGAVFKDASERFNAEAQYNNNWGNFYAILGAQYQLDMADSKGTYLLDQDGPINLSQTGFYTQLEYKLSDSGWNFLAGARLDNHELYGTNFIPKFAITKTVNNSTFRITYGKGIAVPSILNLQGNLFGGLILGNGEGFTLADGTQIRELEVETINSYEIGYKGKIADKLFIDANAYYNQSENFISPLRNITAASPVTHVGDRPIGDVVPGSDGSFILTYSNFGNVDTYGFDVGFNYYFDDNFRTSINYSWFGRSLDMDDLDNDGNLDGIVLETELPINTPANKFSVGLHYSKNKFYGTLYTRWVQDYDFFSGINIAAKTQDLDGDGIDDVIEDARNGRTWNYGPLGGFTIDINLGYNITNNLTLSANVTNLFNSELREFVAAPPIGTLVAVELKYITNFFKKKNNE